MIITRKNKTGSPSRSAFIFLIVSAMLAVPFQAAAQEEPPMETTPEVSSKKKTGQVFLGAVGGLALGVAGAALGYLVDKESDNDTGLFGGPGLAAGYLAGSTLGAAVGVSLAGNNRKVKGSFSRALLGSLIGQGLALAAGTLLGNRGGTLSGVAVLIAPAICSTIYFNRSLRYREAPVSHALLNFNRGKMEVGFPYIDVQPLIPPRYVKHAKPTFRLNVNLVSVVL